MREGFSVFNLVTGLVIAGVCIAYSKIFLPFNTVAKVNIFKLIVYFFYLVGQIYLSGFHVIKMIVFKKARADIMEVKTVLTNDVLRVILADSITLTPGSVLLDLTDDKITALVLMSQDDPVEIENTDDLVKGRLEEKLLSAER